MNIGTSILILVAFVSFLMGRHFGRVRFYEEVVTHANFLDNVAMKMVLIDYNQLNKTLHWGTELIPGYFYYGFNVMGLKLGFTRTKVAGMKPIPPLTQR